MKCKDIIQGHYGHTVNKINRGKIPIWEYKNNISESYQNYCTLH